MLFADTVASVGAAFVLAGITAVLLMLIWQGFGLKRARQSLAREGAYRELAERSAAAQERTAQAMEKAVTELSDLGRRTSELERVLKEVE